MTTRIQLLSALGLCTFLIAVAPVRAQQFSDWSTPMNLGPVVNSSGGDFFPSISKDGLSLYFTSSRSAPGAQGGWDIYVSQRASVSEPWGPAQNLGPPINTPFDEGAPFLSVDGHRMYFASTRPGGFGGNDIYVSRRRNKRDDFGWQGRQTSVVKSTRPRTKQAPRSSRMTRERPLSTSTPIGRVKTLSRTLSCGCPRAQRRGIRGGSR